MNAHDNGTAAAELDNLIADFRRHIQQLLANNDQLQQEIVDLRRQVAAWKERHENCAYLLRHADSIRQTPEELERIVRHGQWVDYQEIVKVVAQVQESAHG